MQHKEQAKPFSSQLRDRLAGVERRDWELWVLALATVLILAAGFFFVLVPAVFFAAGQLFVKLMVGVLIDNVLPGLHLFNDTPCRR